MSTQPGSSSSAFEMTVKFKQASVLDLPGMELDFQIPDAPSAAQRGVSGAKDAITVNRVRQDCVVNIKDALQDALGVPQERIMLIYGGRELEDHSTLVDYGVTDGSTVHFNTKKTSANWPGGRS